MENIVKTVDRAELDRLIEKEAFTPRLCPMCRRGTEIIIDLPIIDNQSITIRCKHCNYSVKEAIRFEYFSSGEKFGTFVTTESFAKSLFEAVDKWNTRYEVNANA